MGKGIEEIGSNQAGLAWDDGIELRRASRGRTVEFHLHLGAACVGVLAIASGRVAIRAEAAWARRLLEEVLDEWRRTECPPLELAA